MTDIIPRSADDLTRAEDHRKAAAYAVNAKAPATQDAYRSDWEDFVGWCRSRGYVELPASPQTVAAYLAALADVAKATTVQRRLSAIRYAHLISGNATPTADPYVREVMDGIRRVKGTRPRQAQAATLDPLRAMLATLPNDLSGLRDRALLLVGFAGGFRRAALCALDRADVTFVPEGMDLIIRKDKTDQIGQGREIAISYGKHRDTCPVRALRDWLEAAGISAGPIFRGVAKGGRTVRQGRLDPGSVARIIKRAAARAGLPDADDFSGHSLRSGLATEAARSGATDNAIMDQTGHTDVRSVKRYIRRGRRFTDNVLTGLWRKSVTNRAFQWASQRVMRQTSPCGAADRVSTVR